MEIGKYIEQQKKLYNLLMLFIEKDSGIESDYNQDIDFQNFIRYIENQKLTSIKEEFRLLLLTISKISNNHHRFPTFLSKVEQILFHFGEQIRKSFSNCEIFNIFKSNKKVILFLFEKKIITADIYILKSIYTRNKSEIRDFIQFFYTEFKTILEKEGDDDFSEIEESVLKCCNNNFDVFDEKRKTGENDGYICELIRKDMYEKFNEYVNNTNLSPSSFIERSPFETNSFLIKEKETSLIEYAAFFGSIQTFKYLMLKNAELRPKLWLYAIHGHNSEIIHLLEENHVVPTEKNFEECLKESIKCHHNEITNYIMENFLNTDVDKYNIENIYEKNSLFYCFHYFNFKFFPNNIENYKFSFCYSCDYGYLTLVNLFLNNDKNIDVNEHVILIKTKKIYVVFNIVSFSNKIQSFVIF